MDVEATGEGVELATDSHTLTQASVLGTDPPPPPPGGGRYA